MISVGLLLLRDDPALFLLLLLPLLPAAVRPLPPPPLPEALRLVPVVPLVEPRLVASAEPGMLEQRFQGLDGV